MNHFVILSGIGYKVTVADLQVIFEEEISVFGHFNRFTLERPREINDSGGIWYLVEMEFTTMGIPASHIIKAVEWCNEMFGKSFEPYKGALA